MIDILQQYGFSEKEAKVYLAGLELGSAPGSTIARLAGEKRVTVYSIIKELIKKGCMTELKRNGMNYFSVVAPDILAAQLENKYQAFHQKLPELMALAEKFGNKPKVQFFEGVEGLKHVCESILIESKDMDKGDYLIAFEGSKDIDATFASYLETDFAALRKQYPIKTKMIISSDDSSYSKLNSRLHEHIVVDDPIFRLANEIVLYDKQKVALLLYNKDEKSACIIESKTLYDALRSMFELLWKYLYKPTKQGSKKGSLKK